jgi:hypothetical protein
MRNTWKRTWNGRGCQNPHRCQRCQATTDYTIMSMFNTQIICMACKDKERRHPRYTEAVSAECEAVQRGNTNFLGIGKPENL